MENCVTETHFKRIFISYKIYGILNIEKEQEKTYDYKIREFYKWETKIILAYIYLLFVSHAELRPGRKTDLKELAEESQVHY